MSTVIFAEELINKPSIEYAVITLFPRPTDLTIPELSTVATLLSEDNHKIV
jgi:hypothetical protein